MSFWISALAPTSIPRVGSSRMSRVGCVASQRATMAFCWFPPERFLMAWAAVGVRMSRSLMYRSAISSWRARGMFLNQPCLTCSARTMFSRRERSSMIPSLFRSSGQSPIPDWRARSGLLSLTFSPWTSTSP